MIQEACVYKGASETQALACGSKVAEFFIGKEKDKGKKKKDSQKSDQEESSQPQKENETLIFLSPSEVKLLAKRFQDNDFDVKSLDSEQELKKLLKSATGIDAVDIALFGRMVAKAPSMNVEAATCFSHAISTHKVHNEVEFFTALDDRATEPGAAHLGSLEFNSATYYRYISLDLGQLYQTLAGVDISKAVEYFIKALFLAIPSGRQNTQSGASFWDFAKVFIRKGQRLQVPFAAAVQAKNGGYLDTSIEYMQQYLSDKEKMAGSLFQKVDEYTLGGDENTLSIDGLLQALCQYVEETVK